MNKKREQWLRISNQALSGVLALLGFASCVGGNSEERREEYGTPITSYEIKGKVVDAQEAPVSNARVIIKQMFDGKLLPESNFPRDVVETNASGEYTSQGKSVVGELEFRVVCEDQRDIYEADSVDVKMDRPTNGEGWYQGSTSKEVNFKLTKEKDAE